MCNTLSSVHNGVMLVRYKYLLIGCSVPFVCNNTDTEMYSFHDDAIKWKHFSRFWSFVSGIHWSQRPVTRSFDFFNCTSTNSWANSRNAGDLRRRRAHYDVTVMLMKFSLLAALESVFECSQLWTFRENDGILVSVKFSVAGCHSHAGVQFICCKLVS